MIKQLIIRLIKTYQRFSATKAMPQCRFYPSCSQYAIDALNTKPLWYASGLIVIRLGKCHPWHVGGLDPVRR